MKILVPLSIAFASVLAACNSNTDSAKDSVDVADSANKANMDSSTAQQPISTDAESSAFLVEAADGGMAEVHLGSLAQQQARYQGVKDFGSMMVRDHSAAGDKIKMLASQRNVTLPTTVSDKNQKMFDDLSKKKGADFDKAYMDHMVKDHEEDIDAFKKAADKVNDADVKALINATIPTLQTHLDSAKAVRKRLK
jgi:putative membrane protein